MIIKISEEPLSLCPICWGQIDNVVDGPTHSFYKCWGCSKMHSARRQWLRGSVTIDETTYLCLSVSGRIS